MIRALLWKEYREQRLVWLALAVLGVLVVGVPVWVSRTWAAWDIAIGITLLVTFVYGLVCGAMLLAGECEAGTLPFLDALPRWRVQVWTVKVLAGSLFTLALVLLLTGLLLGLTHLLPVQFGQAPWTGNVRALFFLALVLAVVGWAGFTWGLLGATLCRSVIAAVGVGFLLPGVIGLVLAFFLLVLLRRWVPPSLLEADKGIVLLYGVTAVFSLVSSAWLFCRPDRERLARLGRRAAVRARVSLWAGWRAVTWLTVRQARVQVLVLGIGALVAGWFLPLYGFLLWPAATLLLGIWCGLATFAGEQTAQAYRFLGDQRLPLGRVWLVKTFGWLAIAGVLGLLILLGGTVQLAVLNASPLADPKRSRPAYWVQLVGPGGSLWSMSPWLFLVLWLAYGFAVGQLLALLTRKTAVALAVALFVSLLVVGPWLPSLVVGGLAAYQPLVVPLLLLVAARLSLWAWVGERLGAARQVVGLLGGAVLVAAWVAGCLWYRVAEIPDVGEPFDVRAYEASLSAEKSPAGALLRGASRQLKDQGRIMNEDGNTVMSNDERDQLRQLLEYGWPQQGKPTIGPWLDQMCRGRWVQSVREAAEAPRGMIEDPRSARAADAVRDVDGYDMATLLLARALQLQARGDSAAALDRITWVLAMSRDLRYRGLRFTYFEGLHVEEEAVSVLEQWLDRVGPRRELLLDALEELTRHEAETPPPSEHVRAEYVNVRRRLEGLSQDWFRRPEIKNRDPEPELKDDLKALAWQAPWEQARRLRLLNLVARRNLAVADADYAQPAPSPDAGPLPFSLAETERATLEDIGLWLRGYRPVVHEADGLSLCRVRAVRLLLALALYEVEQGKPPTALAQLVPRYLPALPIDPFSGGPFRYRVSRGEFIRVEVTQGDEDVEVKRAVAAGRGVLWSVGLDHTDNSGTRQGLDIPPWSASWADGGYDLIFLVPRWAGR